MARGGGRFRRIGASLAVVVTGGVFFLCQPFDNTSGAAATKALPRALGLLLRLHDLPLGYRLLNVGPPPEFRVQPILCDSVDPANPQPPLATFLEQYSPSGCFAVYLRLFHVQGTRPASVAVGTGAMETKSVQGAEAGLAVAPELLSHLIGDELPEEAQPSATVGDGTRLFHWQHPALFKHGERSSSSFLVWRSGGVVAATFATGGSTQANDRAALEVALIQQKHIETPIRSRPGEFDNAEVALENPKLEVPVYWLGRRFAPGRGLTKLRLYDSSSTTAGGLRSPRVDLLYVDNPTLSHAEAVNLNLWSPRQWRRLKARGTELPGSPPCAATKPVKLAGEGALIYSGFEAGVHQCRDHTRQRSFTARIYLGRVIVTAETMTTCAVCASAGAGPYDSLAGMKAVARGLAVRRRSSR
jgi:hypothetical protein